VVPLLVHSHRLPLSSSVGSRPLYLEQSLSPLLNWLLLSDSRVPGRNYVQEFDKQTLYHGKQRLIAFQFNRLRSSCSLRGNPLTADDNSALGSLHHVDVVSDASVTEVRAASIFRAEVSKVGELEYCHEFGGLCMTCKTGSGLDDWIYWHLSHTSWDYRQLQRYCWSTHFTVHRCTRSRILSLH
jgi:hypothetical protein